jgi:DNA-binding Lrp family transcriptional regulator
MATTDQKLIVLLDENPKISQSSLAKKLHISQQVVNYKLSQLLAKGRIIKFSAIIDFMKLGYEQYHLFLRLNKFIEIEKELFDYLSTKRSIWWAAKIGALYDIQIQLMVKNYAALESFIEQLHQKFPGVFGDYFVLRVNEHMLYNHAVFSDLQSIKRKMSYRMPETAAIRELDNIDRQIIAQVKDNCRLSSLAIANQIGVSYKTVQSRIQKLEKEKIIAGYRLFHHLSEHKAFLMLIEFGFYSADMEKKLIADIYNTPQFTQYWKVSGKYTLSLHARCHDYEALHNLFAKLREKHPIIKEYLLIPVFKDIIINTCPIE